MAENRRISTKEFLTSLMKYSITYIAVSAINILIVPILTRCFSVEEYGYISLYTNAATYIYAFACLGLPNSLSRFYYYLDEENGERKLAIITLLIPAVIIFLMFVFSLVIGLDNVAKLILGIEDGSVLKYLFIYAYAVSFFIIVPIYFKMKEDIRNYTLMQILSSLMAKVSVLIALLGGAVISYRELSIWQAFGSVVLFIVVCVIYFRKIFTYKLYKINLFKKKYIEIYKFAIFSWPVTILIYSNQYLVQSIITKNLNAYYLGLYSALNLFVGIITAVRGGFSTYWSVFIYRYYKTEQKKIMVIHDVVMIFCVLLTSSLVLFRDLLYLIIGEKYIESQSIFIMIIAYYIFTFAADTTIYGCNINKKPQIITLISFVSAANVKI